VLGALIKSLRPHQWVKNLFVVAPLLFSKHLLDPAYALQSGLAFLIFCLLSASVYLVNDLFDIEKDRAHPTKCHRPIASGRLPLNIARTAAALIIVASLALALLVDLPFFASSATYLVLNLAYSLSLKHIPFLDVLSLAGFFLLRVEAGALALRVPASPWLLLCTFELACFLGFGKRAHEIATAGDRASEQRAVLSRYNPRLLRVILWVLGVATVVTYVFYTLSVHTREAFGGIRLLYTSPFLAFALIRFLMIVGDRTSPESPTDKMLHDKPFMVNAILSAAVLVVVIYFLG
jgi:decaprenyl-phosphate phosphoribosyltransferase